MATPISLTANNLTTALTSSGLPTPSPHFINNVLSTQRASPPFPALLATAKHRLLSSDITSCPSPLAPNTLSFPPNLSDPQIKEQTLRGPIPAQVLSVEDLSKSRWEQIEAIEAAERGETTKGREIIRVIASEDRGGEGIETDAVRQAGANGRAGPHRLVLQDVKGQTVYGLELRAVKGVGLDMSIGTKMMLSGVVIARGVLLLEPGKVTVLGGKIESLQKRWIENRKKDLEAAIA